MSARPGLLWAPAGLTALAGATAFALAVLASHGWEPRAFILERPPEAPPEQTWAIGYDGQQAYALALDPRHAAQQLDRPAYRAMRIVYPMLARALALGQPQAIPWTLLGVNLAAAALTAALLGGMARARAVSGWSAFVLIASFNYLIGLRLDLNEPLALALALAGVAAYERGRLAWAVGLFCGAALTKDLALAFPLSLAAHALVSGRRAHAGALAGLPLLAYLAWAACAAWWMGASPFDPTLARMTWVPFSGLLAVEGLETRVVIVLWAAAPALLAGAAAAWALVRSGLSGAGADAWMVLAHAVLIATLPLATWVDPLAVLRVACGLIAALVLWLARARPRALRFAAALWTPSLLLAFLLPGFML